MSKITQEQMCCIFPNLRNESERKDFDERHKQFFDVLNHTWAFAVRSTRSYRLKNSLLPVSVPRKLTPESVCLMQASQVSYDKLLKSGIRCILSFSSTQGTSGRARVD